LNLFQELNMDIKELLEQLGNGEISLPDALLAAAAEPPAIDPDGVQIDRSRQQRCGFPEVIYGAGKTAEQIAAIVERMLAEGLPVLATRVDADKADIVTSRCPDTIYDPLARVITASSNTPPPETPKVLIITAGTSDMPVALEAKYTLELCGVGCALVNDAGVAGLHRLLKHLPQLQNAEVIIVCAGMEGALPSVVGGLVDCPVIAVPTSVGYGASLNGFAALLGMLSSCAGGVTVVNIDNGFGAGCAAVRMVSN
jgi:pyridinium-3,5-biscarboxylic acid mononucleotide synthase